MQRRPRTVPDMSSSVATRIRLAILVMLAAPQFLIGLWAVATPRHWFDRFPGIGPRLVAAEPPFNEHLATDAGAGFLTTGLALAVAAVWGHRVAIRTALLAYVTFAAPHLLYHAANPSAELTSSEDSSTSSCWRPVRRSPRYSPGGSSTPALSLPLHHNKKGKTRYPMMLKRKLLAALAVLVSGIVASALPAGASHDHFLRTPGGCHQVAPGSTARHHQFHVHVHEPLGKNGGPLDPANPGGPPVGLSTTAC